MLKALTICTYLLFASIYTQEIDLTGTYYWEINPSNAGKHSRTLTINEDGTFLFVRYREAHKLNPISEIYGKGSWTSKGKYIYFTTDSETELDTKYTLNFTNTKGRWDARNNRLILYESDIFWLDKFAMEKK